MGDVIPENEVKTRLITVGRLCVNGSMEWKRVVLLLEKKRLIKNLDFYKILKLNVLILK